LPAYVATAGKLQLTVLYRGVKKSTVNDAVLDSRTGTPGTLVSTGLMR
jgi:hypothetical protein